MSILIYILLGASIAKDPQNPLTLNTCQVLCKAEPPLEKLKNHKGEAPSEKLKNQKEG